MSGPDADPGRQPWRERSTERPAKVKIRGSESSRGGVKFTVRRGRKGTDCMGKLFKTTFALLTFALLPSCVLLSPRSARADDIVPVVDEHGHLIYINTGDPVLQKSSPHTFRPLRIVPASLPSPEINHMVEGTAKQFAVDPQLVHAIIDVESRYNPNAVSRKGAMGLMQLVPATAMRFGVENPFDPRQNIRGGVSYLKYLLDLFGGDVTLSVAAYNAGEHSVLRQGGVPSITETRNYVRMVTARYGGSVPELDAPDAGRTQTGSRSPQQAGRKNPAAKLRALRPETPPIYRYVDAQGVVHFNND